MFPTPGSTSSSSGSPIPTFTFCFTFLHVLFERCDYFNNGCVLFSISFLSFLFTYFFPVCLPGITHPGWSALLPAAPLNSECRGRGGRATLSSPPRPTFTASITLSNFLAVYVATEFKRLSSKGSLHNSQILLMIVSLSSPLCSQFSICFFRYSYRRCSRF